MNLDLKITIVTVVYNCEDSIEVTLVSVKEQTYKNLELIVIDGGSNDSTLSIVEKYKDSISCLVSEDDKGIYDAMNKGTSLATGDYITYLNSGDVYFSNNTLEQVFSIENLVSFDVIYGSNYYSKNNRMILQVPRPLTLFYRGMPFNHQSAFVKTKIAKKYSFKHEVYNIQCEYQFLLNLYLEGYSFHNVDVIVAIYEAGGFSDLRFLERTLERWLIVKRAGMCDSEVDECYFNLVSKELLGKPILSISEKFRAQLSKAKSAIKARLFR